MNKYDSWISIVYQPPLGCLAHRAIEVAHPTVEITDPLVRIGCRQIQQAIALKRQLYSKDRTEVILPVDGLGERVILHARREGSGSFPYVMKSVLRSRDINWSRFEPDRSSKSVDVETRMKIAVKAVQEGSLAYPSYHGLEHRDRLLGLKIPDDREKSVELIKRIVYQSVRCAAGCLSSVRPMVYRCNIQLAIPAVGDGDNEFRLHPELFVVLRFDNGSVYAPTILSREMVEADTALPQEFLKKKAA